MNRAEKTADLHRNGGLSCSQALLTVYGEAYGIKPEQARVFGRTLAGGVAGQGETCGYVTAALLILAHAYNDPDEMQARKKTHPAAETLLRQFRERRGTLLCKELLGADLGTPEGRKKITEEKLVAKYCNGDDGIARDAAAILEALIP